MMQWRSEFISRPPRFLCCPSSDCRSSLPELEESVQDGCGIAEDSRIHDLVSTVADLRLALL
jgi:hypothetical protein